MDHFELQPVNTIMRFVLAVPSRNQFFFVQISRANITYFDREMNHMHQGFLRNVIYAKGASLSLLILFPDLSPRVRPDLIIMSSDGKSINPNRKCHCITTVKFLYSELEFKLRLTK